MKSLLIWGMPMPDTPLWTAQDIIKATHGSCHTDDWQVEGIAIDNRVVKKGDLFISIVGPNNDGHDYVGAALSAGAAGAIVSRVPAGLEKTETLILVDDTQNAMEKLGAAARARTEAKVIAVTGSVGKTGTKEALGHLLGEQGRTHFSVGSFNNHWGVPLSLARMPKETEFAIFELGMNHAGELGPLSRMVKPDVAIITIIAAAHLEFFENTEEIARAKAEIFEGVKPEGTVLLNADDPHCDLLSKLAGERGSLNITYFGEENVANIHLEEAKLLPASSAISASVFGQKLSFIFPVPGRHWVQNILAVLGAVQLVGGDVLVALKDLDGLAPPAGRGATFSLNCQDGHYTVIDESYNASPIAMQAAFRVLGGKKVADPGRKIAVLGDMLELGGKSAEIHRNLANDLLANGIDMVYASGPNMRHLFDALPTRLQAGYGNSSDELTTPLLQAVNDGDIVLIKGSLGSKMKIVLEALKRASEDLSSGKRGNQNAV